MVKSYMNRRAGQACRIFNPETGKQSTSILRSTVVSMSGMAMDMMRVMMSTMMVAIIKEKLIYMLY